jgi:hypothetical protein
LDIALNPRATVHVPASSLLHGEPAGILSIDPSDDGALRIKGLEYTFDSNGKLSHALSVDSYEPFASELSGSFNLYLGMANWLRLANVSGEAQSLVISMHTAWGSISRHVELSGYGRVDLPLHDDREYSLGPDTYGVISIAGAGPGSCIAQLIRQGFDGPNLDFSVATSVR